jgi:hypothetical protein
MGDGLGVVLVYMSGIFDCTQYTLLAELTVKREGAQLL